MTAAVPHAAARQPPEANTPSPNRGATPRTGDRDAVARHLLTHEQILLRYARAALVDSDSAADAVQETMVSAWQRWDRFRGESAVRTWLYSICAHKIADIRRAESAASRMHPGLDMFTWRSSAPEPHHAAVSSHFFGALATALAGLPTTQRTVWVLREIDDASFVDIGHTLGLAASTVRGHHRRATNTLALRLADWK